MEKFHSNPAMERMRIEEARYEDWLAHQERLQVAQEEIAPSLGDAALTFANREAGDIAPVMSLGLVDSDSNSPEFASLEASYETKQTIGQTALPEVEIVPSQSENFNLNSLNQEALATAAYARAA